MESVEDIFVYCCVSKGGRVLYSYNSGGNPLIEDVAALCLEMTPPYHRWYLETMNRKTFGFLMDEGYVYFAISNDNLGNARFLRFLRKLREEFRKLVSVKGGCSSAINVSALNSLCLQQHLLPVVRGFVASLDHRLSGGIGGGNAAQLLPIASTYHSPGPGRIDSNGNSLDAAGGSASTKAPLLGKKPSKLEKKKIKDHHQHHVISMRDIEMEEQRRSAERAAAAVRYPPDSAAADSNNLQATAASPPLRKDYSSSSRGKLSSQNLQNKWCRQVRIVLAIDAAVCLVLFAIWLIICRGIDCIR